MEATVAGRWSPAEQIAHWLPWPYPADPTMRRGASRVSHETIYLSYLSLFVQRRGALRRELTTHLRTHRA